MIPRRKFLKGMGATMALPWLESLQPNLACADHAATAHPNRMVFVYVPNGVIKDKWTPVEMGRDYQLTATLEPLASVKDELIVFSNLSQDNGQAKGDGAGDHARGTATFLTGEHPYKTDGVAIRAGISADQVAASRVGYQTALASLELGTDQGARAGNCDSGYSCAYSSTISWKTPTTPLPKETQPKLVFERLFGGDPASDPQRRKRDFFRKSILDAVADDANRLRKQLGQTDRRKMDEYFTTVRELERRIELGAKSAQRPPQGVIAPTGIPDDFQEYVRLMYDLMILALQTDSTRVSTFMIGNAGSNRAYEEVGVKEGWHSLSHHQNKTGKMEQLQRIDQFQITQFAYFLEKMKSTKEGEGTLLDHSMILYGSELGDGNRHTHHDLPILLAGRAGGSISPGRHVRYQDETPLNNLFLSMLDRMEASVDSLGDSTGRLADLEG